MNLSIEETRLLAKLERDMDAGAVPFVMYEGQRLAVTEDAMAELGFEQGQSIKLPLFIALTQFNISQCEAQIAIQNAQGAA